MSAGRMHTWLCRDEDDDGDENDKGWAEVFLSWRLSYREKGG